MERPLPFLGRTNQLTALELLRMEDPKHEHLVPTDYAFLSGVNFLENMTLEVIVVNGDLCSLLSFSAEGRTLKSLRLCGCSFEGGVDGIFSDLRFNISSLISASAQSHNEGFRRRFGCAFRLRVKASA